MENLFVKKNPLPDLLPSLITIISTNKLRYNQIYQLKTILMINSSEKWDKNIQAAAYNGMHIILLLVNKFNVKIFILPTIPELKILKFSSFMDKIRLSFIRLSFIIGSI